MQYEKQECSLSIEPKSISTAQNWYIVYSIQLEIIDSKQRMWRF